MSTALDTATPDAARLYDYLLGGKEAFAADRELTARIEAMYPPRDPSWSRELAARNRLWLHRAVSSSVHDGIGQVLDLGAGYPAAEPLHATARKARGTARVAYVDIDPVVVSHGRASVEGIPGVAFASGDLGRPGEVLGNPDVRTVIDPARPLLAVFGTVLNRTDAATARLIIAGWAEWLAPGSRIAVTVASWRDREVWERVRAAYPVRLHNHSAGQVGKWFLGLDLLGGGVEQARGWGPACLVESGPAAILAGVGRKP